MRHTRRSWITARALLALLLVALFSMLVPGTIKAAAGDVDPTFDPLGGPDALVYTTVPQADGKLLIGGLFTSCFLPRRAGRFPPPAKLLPISYRSPIAFFYRTSNNRGGLAFARRARSYTT